MRTEILRVDPARPDPSAIARAANVLLAGGLVAFPTETVYGLGALADDPACVAKIYAAKGRPAHNPLIAHVPGEPEARAAASSWPAAAAELARAFWPGPLTLVVPRGARIPAALSAGRDTVALRAPDHPVALALLRAVGRPVAAPSANPSNTLSPTRAEHVLKGLGGRVDLILDAGPCAFGIESTVVDVSREPPRVLRPGALSLARLRAVVPGLLAGAAPAPDGAGHASPGMDRKHYAPAARVLIVPREGIASAAAAAAAAGARPVGLLGLEPAPERFAPEIARALVLPRDPEGYAAGLFDSLHALDDFGCSTVLVEAVPDDEAWGAVRDRLSRAAAD